MGVLSTFAVLLSVPIVTLILFSQLRSLSMCRFGPYRHSDVLTSNLPDWRLFAPLPFNVDHHLLGKQASPEGWQVVWSPKTWSIIRSYWNPDRRIAAALQQGENELVAYARASVPIQSSAIFAQLCLAAEMWSETEKPNSLHISFLASKPVESQIKLREYTLILSARADCT